MKTNPLQFVLSGISTEKFLIHYTPNFENGDVDFSTQVQFFSDIETKTINYKIGLVFNQNQQTFLTFDACCSFTISPSSWSVLVGKQKNKIVIPQGFATHLAIITVGTVRGILFARTENTLLNALIVPTINLTEIIKSDVIIENVI